jgi:hypothetical protein
MPIGKNGEASDLWLSLVRVGARKVSILVGAAEAVALAGDLLRARQHCPGRVAAA